MAQKIFSLVFVFALTTSAFSSPTISDLKVRPRNEFLTSGRNGLLKAGNERISLQEAINLAMRNVAPMKLDATGDANTYVDALLEIVRLYMDELGLDNIALPDESVGFNTEFLFFPIYASVNLTSGFLKGIDTIHRTGDCTVTTSGENIDISVQIGFTAPSAGYDVTTDIEGILLHGSVEASIQDISVQLVMFVDTNNWSSYVDSFDILDIGFISVSVTGLGIFNPLADLFTEAIANLLKGIVGNLLENTIAQVIQDVLDKIFPGNAALGGGFMKIEDTSVALQNSVKYMQHHTVDIFKMMKNII